jgi:hypothetical protein
MIQITAIRLDGAVTHENVTAVLWQSTSSSGHSSRQGLIEWLRAEVGNKAVVAGNGHLTPVLVVEVAAAEHLRACRDGTWTDDLLQLPRF